MKKKVKRSSYSLFTGLALFFIGLFLGNMLLVKNILFSLAAILAGYHIIGEGFGDTYRDTKNNRKFSPNIHLLMTLAAVGSALMGSFEESALLILILRRRISLKIMPKAKVNVKLQNY